ncbi:MAG: translation initiation factor IF-2 [Acidobacteria bacterium]|nr:translation initiation factor IF-2 [Acidobacteriota bacterium]MCW5966895.1 translation initiation factor IF-2 [Blastocatellales bacterium]
MGKVRIYELAKELKLENRKVLEDARRLGVDVSVPSNTLDDPIADKIREMYYPKKESTTIHRSARLVKTVKPAPAVETASPALGPESAQPAPGRESTAALPAETVASPQPEAPRARVVKLAPPVPAAAPSPAAPEAPAEPAEEAVLEVVAEQLADAAAKPAPEAPEEQPSVSEPAEEKIEPAAAAPSAVVEEIIPLAAEPPAATEQRIERPTAPPAAPKAPPSPAVSSHGRPATPGGTNVIRLTPPKGRPMPTPAAPRAGAPTGRTQSGRPAPTPAAREGRPPRSGGARTEAKPGSDVHLLPSGAPQRSVYIPPRDTRHKGRHGARPRGADKQEGHQSKIGTRRTGQPAPQMRPAPPTELKPVRLVEGATVREFAEKLDIKPKDVVSVLFERGVMATINQTLNADVAREIGLHFGFDVTFGAFEDMTVETEFEITPEAMEDTESRAPVVTVMGHVDHGKTSLLDSIRKARVAEGEAGGITQHIGAYSVEVSNPDNPAEMRRIVFLDTPGHEAFTMMRARGARVTDVVILVVAADDGVMPQTVEAIEHARAANVPIIVAINKIDKPDANPDRVRKELADRGLLWDAWGGTTTMVEVSAKKQQNIEGLLEMILLTSDLLELKSNPKRLATGTVLEAKLDRGRGAVATVLIQNGSLKVGDPFIVGQFFGRVRALVDDRGRQIQETGPATPVEVLGLQGVPSAGDQFQVVSDVAKAQQISQYRQTKARSAALARSAARGLDQLHAQMVAGEIKELLVILKADVQGSVEVLKDTLVKLSTEKVKVRIIRSGVGAITESDVLLASASNATTTGTATVIIGFNVRPETRADDIARQENVDIRLHSIIYKVEEEIRAAMLGMLDATIKEVVIGRAEIRDVIRVPKVGSVAGCMVINGNLRRTAHARLLRDNVQVFEGMIGSLRRFKEDVGEVQQGFECGVTIERFNDYKVGDVIEAYITEKVAPTQL